MIIRPNSQQMEGFARVCDSLASLSIASFVVSLSGHLAVSIFESIGLGTAMVINLGLGYFFRRAKK